MNSLRKQSEQMFKMTINRRLSTQEIATKTATPVMKVAPPTPSVVNKGGSSFFQRFSSFLAGCGVGFGVSWYFIYNELVESNEKLSKDLQGMLK